MHIGPSNVCVCLDQPRRVQPKEIIRTNGAEIKVAKALEAPRIGLEVDLRAAALA